MVSRLQKVDWTLICFTSPFGSRFILFRSLGFYQNQFFLPQVHVDTSFIEPQCSGSPTMRFGGGTGQARHQTRGCSFKLPTQLPLELDSTSKYHRSATAAVSGLALCYKNISHRCGAVPRMHSDELRWSLMDLLLSQLNDKNINWPRFLKRSAGVFFLQNCEKCHVYHR